MMLSRLKTLLVACLGILLLCGFRARAATYNGWSGSIRLDTDQVSLIAVPAIGRIMHFALKGYDNVFWENSYFKGQVADPARNGTPYWYNFGGAKLWVAPQSRWADRWWNWPPPYSLDVAPWQVEGTDPLILTGQPSPEARVQLSRSIQLTEQGADLTYTMRNWSEHPVEWGIWMVIQAVPGGRLFIPEAEQIWMGPDDHRGIPTDFNYHYKNGIYSLDYHQRIDGSKLFATPCQGWMAYEVKDQVFFLGYDGDPEAHYPEGEGSSEVYTGNGYVELEHVGPLVFLDPEELTTLTEYWRIVESPELKSMEEMANWVQTKAYELGFSTVIQETLERIVD